jgi:ABC-type microcin C transport system permease subunit YejE
VESNIEVLTDDTERRDVQLIVAMIAVALVMAFVMPSAIIGLAIGAIVSTFLYRI